MFGPLWISRPLFANPWIIECIKGLLEQFWDNKKWLFCCIEYERVILQEEVHRLHSLENMLREVEESRQNLEKELRSTQRLLDKERAKNHTVQRQLEVCVYFHNMMYFKVKQDIQWEKQCWDMILFNSIVRNGHFVHRRFKWNRQLCVSIWMCWCSRLKIYTAVWKNVRMKKLILPTNSHRSYKKKMCFRSNTHSNRSTFKITQKHLVWLNQPDYIRSHTNKNKPSFSAVPV